MAQINVNDVFQAWVRNHVVPLFQAKGIAVTDNAVNLIAWSMQMQLDENEERTVPNSDRLLALANGIATPVFVDGYVNNYGARPLSFNRAFHLLADLGPRILNKYPWRRTSQQQ